MSDKTKDNQPPSLFDDLSLFTAAKPEGDDAAEGPAKPARSVRVSARPQASSSSILP